MSADVTVEIAFDSGYTTPAASRTWTDVSDYVELAETVTITRGRQDELSEVSPSTVALTFDNRDGRFTPGLASSPYYPNVRIGRPIRVKVTPDGGAESIRFTGYIDEWPVEWDGTDAYARVPITATSRMARLGLAVPAQSVIEEEIRLDGPVAYYTMGDGKGAVAASDSAGQGASSLARMSLGGTNPTFGDATGPGTDGLTAAVFTAGGNALEATLPASPSGDWTVEWFFASTDATTAALIGLGDLTLFMNSTSASDPVELLTRSIQGIVSGVHVDDGSTYHLAIRWTAATSKAELLVNGVLKKTITDATTQVPGKLRVGNFYLEPNYPGNRADWTPGATYAHVAAFHTALPTARIAAHSQAGSDAFAAETPAARLARYATYARLPGAEQSFAAGSAPVAHIDTTGQTVISLMRLVANADGGILFDARDGALTYQDRSARYQPSSTVTLRAASQEVESDYAPRLDRSVLLNDLTTKNIAGTVSVRALDETSRDEYGVHSESLELATDDANELHSAAWWRVNTRAEPSSRVSTLSVDALTRGGHDELLGLDISSQIEVTGLPTQAGAATADFFVEGYTETIGLASHRFTFNVSDAGAWLGTWVLDSATRSQLDSTTVLAY